MNKRITAAAVFFLAAATALAEPVGAEQAAEKVVAAVKTHKLTSLETDAGQPEKKQSEAGICGFRLPLGV